MRYGHNITVASVLVAVICSGCSRPGLSMDDKEPATFHLTGSNQVESFQVGNSAGRVWLLYPKKKRLSLNELATITYGEVPAACWQEIPTNAATPPPLLEGQEYYAFAVIFDDPPVRVRFTVKGGKIIQLSAD